MTQFSDSVLAKARKYRKQGAVLQDVAHPLIWFVKGSAKKPYRVQLIVEDKRVRHITCTCDYGMQTGAGWSNCSHAAAVLLEVKARKASQPKPAESRRTGEKGPRTAEPGLGKVSYSPAPTGPSEAEIENDTFNPENVVWVMQPRDLPKLWQGIEEAVEVEIDLETTGLNEHETGKNPDWPVQARISMASLTLPREDDDEHTVRTYVLPLSHPEGPMRGVWRDVLRQLVRKLRESNLPISNQHLKFDLKWMHAMTRVDLSPQFYWDTQIAGHLLNENGSTRLKEMAPNVFGIRRWDDNDLSTPAASERVPIFELGIYAARDTYWTWRLRRWQQNLMNVGRDRDPEAWPEDSEEMENFRLGTLATWCAMPTSATLTGIEQTGLLTDRDWIMEHIESEQRIFTESYEALVHRYPSDPDREPSFAPTSIWFRDWASMAVAAGDLEVTQMTDSGNPQWNKSVLNRQAASGSPVAETLLKLRDADKKLQFLRGWLPLITPEGTIHTTYWSGRVVTGRLSSSDPNVQQITRSLKPAFIPRPGYVMGELDLSQIELRIAAHVSGSVPMIEAYLAGMDLHRSLGARVAGVAELEDVTPEQRQRAKAGNFGFLYGMGAEGFRHYALDNYGVSFTEEEALAIRAHFFAEWDGIAAWHAKSIERARTDGQVVSPIGRVRRLPNVNDPVLGGHDERKAINSPVQGFASDVMQIAAASIAGNLPTYSPVAGVRLVGTVHDSILVELPEDAAEEKAMECMERMVDVNPVLKNMGCTLKVPLAVEAKIGTRWGLGDIGTLELTGEAG